MPTTINGTNVIMNPQITHHMPVLLNTVAANPLPAPIPTAARKRHMPSSRSMSDADDDV